MVRKVALSDCAFTISTIGYITLDVRIQQNRPNHIVRL
jgi:hypothetical protein